MKNNTITKKVGVRDVIASMLSRHDGFNQCHNFNPAENGVSEIVIVGDSENQYLYVLVENSSKSRLTGILFDSKKETFLELFSVTKTVGTITVESFREFYRIKGDVMTGKDFITGEEFSTTISQTSTGMILIPVSSEVPLETKEVVTITESPVIVTVEEEA